MIKTLRPDVAIVGGGPAGSTVACLLKKYDPKLKVCIYEREIFPRDHVGESQLPHISSILQEMGVWDKVERAEFPIKIGATYRWGKSDQLWDFEFLNGRVFQSEKRPGKYAGQRTQTAFQVDRAIYDKILLDHARSLGCEVIENAKVSGLLIDGDSIRQITVQHEGQTADIQARHYVDCSGHVGALRKALGVEVESPTSLQNIAIWDYWQNADWAVSIGVGGTRVQVLSLGYGWIWFIPLGPTRTSIGLIVPAKYYKERGVRPEELYQEALKSDVVIQTLTKNASRENKLSTTKDWSFIADRLAGENWFLAGECAGFADPILAAGMTLAHKGAREVAYTILELERKKLDPSWLKNRYSDSHRRHILQHIRFADFWYTQNGLFSDLKDFTKEIAGEAGLELTSEEAWRWFGTGGFIDHDSTSTEVAGFGLSAAKHLTRSFLDEPNVSYSIANKTHFQLDVEGAIRSDAASSSGGKITPHRCYQRGNKALPLVSIYAWLALILKSERSVDELLEAAEIYRRNLSAASAAVFPQFLTEVLEGMAMDGWLKTKEVEGLRTWPIQTSRAEAYFHPNEDIAVTISQIPTF